jgi:deoxyribodipyrimidine photolyase-related protein
MREFCRERLAEFGAYQDAMWAGAPFLFHSRISPALNLRLIDPRYVVEKAVEAYQEGSAPINSVEGFVRQIIGWREYVRGMYWTYMPDYGRKNALDAHAPLPSAYWDADIDMACVADSTQSLVAHGYTHHIQRLMVLGLFGLLLGVDPGAFNRWHTSMYLDAHDWVSLPNTLGMSQFADGGFMATKPYSASGNYINRMSNYCKQCPFNHKKALGEDACPITTMYWDFLDRHREKFRGNRRMMFQLKNLERKSADEMAAIREQAERVRARYAKGAAHAGN